MEKDHFVYVKSLKKYAKVLDIKELWGYKIYVVLDTSSNVVYEVTDIDIEEDVKFNVYEFKYILNAAKLKNIISGGILSPLSGSILPLPHQIYTLKRALSSDKVRFVLADEVGLGKTIEAGLIMKELKLRGLIKRILILAPKGLILQWQEEMKEKFSEDFRIILPQDLDVLKRVYDKENIWTIFDQVISSHDSVKPIEGRAGWTAEKIEEVNTQRFLNLINANWDLIVIDEAHRLAGATSNVARYKLGKALAVASPYLLLLTATPHQGKSDSFLRLMRFIDQYAFPTEKAITKEQVAPFIIRTEKREAIDFNGNKLFKNRYTKLISIRWQEKHSLQKLLYKKVTEYVAKGYNQAVKEKKTYIGFLLILMQRLVTSSTRAIKDYIERRIKILENQEFLNKDIDFEEIYDEAMEYAKQSLLQTVSFNIKKEITQLKEILSVANQAEAQFIDAKAEALLDLIFKIRMEQKDSKFLIFTEFIETQEYLYDILTNQGYNVVKLNGSMNIEERKEILSKFKENADILISTDAGGEGINLQFCNIVINYDMPWNPMKIEQRIGRVDRIGQQKDVFVFNFVLEDTVENRVREILEEKLRVIFQEFGVDKMGDILDSFEAGIDFTEVYIKSISNPSNLERYVYSIENKIREKTEILHKMKDILKDEKVLSVNLLAELPSDKVDEYIRKMYLYKEISLGNEADILNISEETLSLENDKIKELLNIPEYPISKRIPVVKLESNTIYEKGYWSLWEVGIKNTQRYCKVFPVFINLEGDYRPGTSKTVWDILLKESFDFSQDIDIDETLLEKTKITAIELAYNHFSEMRKEYIEQINKEIEKFKIAFSLKKKLH
ncbi:DEAD/DEAH box helicase [Caldicellulosiruptor danielii]|uniref:Helicase-related protein n=1 Tax=Anaerocellum danielii TaxID=1387557 RepID=A0ABZ0U3J9_9FIRM|nr:helicase-related protein [Caldicellulosiruptor danielii]WPX09632.1 helicase-related protein [Caldicellulosiruptor danielii]